MLRQPLEQLAERCTSAWENTEALDAILAECVHAIPHCSFVYCVEIDGVQICNSISQDGIDASPYLSST